MHRQVTQYRSRDLVQLPTDRELHCALVFARIMHALHQALYGVRATRLPNTELSADSEVTKVRLARLPLLPRPLHLHDAPPSLRLHLHGCLCCRYPRDGAISGVNLGLTVLHTGCAPSPYPALTLRIHGLVVFHTFHPKLNCVDSVFPFFKCIGILLPSRSFTMHPRRPGELHLMICLCESRYSQ